MLGQYEYRIVYNHPRANSEGAVYLHVLVAEEKLGRYLLPEEVVHHIDGDKTNNDPNNLIVFYTKADHSSFHKNGCNINNITLLPCGSYISNTLSTRCPICGEKKSKNGKTCYKCRSVQSNKPSKEELFNKLNETKGNFTNVGKFYNVTDNAIRKWCKSYHLPYHSSDYKS